MPPSIAAANRDQFLSRVNASSHPQAAAMRRVVEDALAVASQFAARRAELDADPKLTSLGRKETLKQELVRRHARDLRDARAPITVAKARLEMLRNAVQAKPSEPDSVSAALLATEIRSAVFAMAPLERAALVTNERTDPRIIEAVLTAPALLSGVDANTMAQIEATYAQARFGSEMAEIEELSELIGNAEATVTVAREDLRSALDMDTRSFDQLVAPIEQRKGGPWLQRSTGPDGREVIVVVPVEGGPDRPATDDEIRDGQFYRDFREYVLSGGDVPDSQKEAARAIRAMA